MKRLFLFFFLISITFGFAQTQNSEEITNLKTPVETLENQFNNLYKKSSKYKEYKVISITKYQGLKNNVLDSIATKQQLIDSKQKTIENTNKEIVELKNNLATTRNNLETAVVLKDHRTLLGISINKSLFSTLIILGYILLILLLSFFIFKYNQNISTTRKAVSDLNSLELEFENHKKTSLKRFQEVSRKLQDELNKKWKKE